MRLRFAAVAYFTVSTGAAQGFTLESTFRRLWAERPELIGVTGRSLPSLCATTQGMGRPPPMVEIVNGFPMLQWLKAKLEELTREDLQGLLDQTAGAGLSRSVVAHLRWQMHAIFRLAIGEGQSLEIPLWAYRYRRTCCAERENGNFRLKMFTGL